MHVENKKIFLILFAFFIIIFCLKYSNFYECHMAKTEEENPKEKILEDYKYMWETLEEEYIFFPVLEEKGIDIETLQKEGIRKIENDINTFDEKAFGRLGSI